MVRRAAQLVCCKPCAGNGNPLNQRGLDSIILDLSDCHM